MAGESVIVIGAGVAGLSAGIYAQANGYDTAVFEMHTSPGGLCTSWEQKGFTFDGCIHWLVGAKPGTGFYSLWQEVGAVDGLELASHDRFVTVRMGDDEVTLWSDLDRTERELLERSPGDRKAIAALVKGARELARIGSNVPHTPPDMMKAWDGVKMLVSSGPAIRNLQRYQATSIGAFAEKFSDPFLRRAIANSVQEPRMSLMALLGTLGWFETGNANWAMGGSLAFARRLERRLLDSGARVEYGARVEHIIVENDRAVGVLLADGTEHRADHVISAADGHATIFEMLEGRYVDDRIRKLYAELEPFSPIVQVSLGVDADLSAEPWSVMVLAPEPLEIGGVPQRSVWSHHYSYDPSMAPGGKSVVTALLAGDLDHWQGMRESDRAAYRMEKDALAEQVIEVVELAYPAIRGKVEAVDVATPATYVRYTGNWRGSFEGWLLSPGNTKLAGMGGLPRTLPGLSGFVMAGQWVWPGGGLPSGVLTGRWAVTTICAADGREFVAPTVA